MASVSHTPYQRLRNEGLFDEGSDQPEHHQRTVRFKKIRVWSKYRKLSAGRRRPRVRILGLRRFLRKRGRLFTRIKVSWGKALRRLKDGQGHMNDLFGGNYLFMQANPMPFKCGERPYNVGHGLHVHGSFPSRY